MASAALSPVYLSNILKALALWLSQPHPTEKPTFQEPLPYPSHPFSFGSPLVEAEPLCDATVPRARALATQTEFSLKALKLWMTGT